MNRSKYCGLGAIVIAFLLVVTQMASWPGYLYYVWALLAIIFGLILVVND